MRSTLKILARKTGLTRWVDEKDALAAVEASFLFPVLFTMMIGMVDLGNGIMAAQKTIRASQAIADLVARKRVVSEFDVTQAIEAGKLALQPYDTTSFCAHITSVRFLADDEVQTVFERGDAACADVEAVNSSVSLGEEGEGAIIVSVKYTFEPWFSGVVIGDMPFKEVAFARGRRSPVVTIQ